MSRVCIRGHASSALPGGRYLNADGKPSNCKECVAESGRSDKRRAYKKIHGAKWRRENAERMSGYWVKYRVENTERLTAYRQRPEVRAVRCALEATREARKLAQTCTCCDAQTIAAFYVQAHAQGLEVDHSLALARGGLHCLKNLKALTPEVHKLKTAHWDMPLIAAEKRKST